MMSGPGQGEELVVAAQVARPVGEPLAPVVGLARARAAGSWCPSRRRSPGRARASRRRAARWRRVAGRASRARGVVLRGGTARTVAADGPSSMAGGASVARPPPIPRTVRGRPRRRPRTVGVMPGPDSDPLPSAVLWDMDGTLVDTEPYWIEAEYALVAEHGGSWSDAQAHSLVGNPLLVSAEVIRDEGGVRPRARRDRRPADVARRRAGALGAAVATGRRAPARRARGPRGAAGDGDDVVGAARRRAPRAPPGRAVRRRGDGRPGRARQAPPRAVPHRDGAAVAARASSPPRAVAIEDSPTGLASAEAAGLATIAVPHVVPVGTAPGRRVLASLDGLSASDLTPPTP